MLDKTITIKLTNAEYSHCEKISRGECDFYIRELIQRDMWGDESLAVYVHKDGDLPHIVRSIAPALDD